MVFPDLNGWLILIRQEWLHTLGWVAGLALVFAVLARWMPCNPGMFWWKDRRAFATDAIYWFVVPLVINVCRTLLLIAAVGLLLEGATSMPLPVGAWPLWLQCLLVLVFQDVLLYWIHRAFHTQLGWGFHTVHHSPTVLDWTATIRFHPLNNLLAFSVADITVLLLGFSRETLIVLAPFNIAYSALVHANLNWTFGPLRYLLASPVFHRWHHTTEREGLNKNFASTFPILDLLFGTYYMPAGKLPEHFGNDEPDFPRGFWGQFVHPFWSRASAIGAWVRGRPGLAALVLVGVLGAGGMLGHWIDARAQLLRQNAQLKQEVALVQQEQAAQAVVSAHSPNPAIVRSVAISASGNCIAICGADGVIKVWDGHGQLKHTLLGHARPASCVAVSSDGRWIISGSFDQTLKVWDAATGRVVRTLRGHTGGVLAVAVSADGRFLVSGSGDFTGRLWDLHTGEEKAMLPSELPGAVVAVAISADGQRIMTTRGTQVRVWDAGTRGELSPLEGHTDNVHGVAISADGRWIVSAGLDGNAIVWDAEQARPRCTLCGHAGPVHGVAIDPEGTTVVTGGADGTVRVWSATTGRQLHLLTGHASAVMAVALDAEGHIVSGSRDGAVKLWPMPKGGTRKLTRRGEPAVPLAAR